MTQVIRHLVVDTGIMRKRTPGWIRTVPGEKNIQKWPSVSVLIDTDQKVLRVVSRAANQPFNKKLCKKILENRFKDQSSGDQLKDMIAQNLDLVPIEYEFTQPFEQFVNDYNPANVNQDLMRFHVFHMLYMIYCNGEFTEAKQHNHLDTLRDISYALKRHETMECMESEFGVTINRYTNKIERFV